jgi:hypothetical protein
MHRFASIFFTTAIVCASAMAHAQGAKPAPRPTAPISPPKVQDRADELFDLGAAAYHAGRYAEAEEKLSQAWALKKTHDIAGNLGVVEFKLGKHPQAAQHITWALQHFPPTESGQARRGYEQLLDKARAESAVLRIQVNVDGAEISVNDRSVDPGEVFVEPGTASLVVRRAGYIPSRQEVSIVKGESRNISIALVPVAGKPERRSVVPGAVLGGVGGAVLITGIALVATAGAKRSSAHDTYASILQAGHSCVAGAGNFDARCNDLASSSSRSDTMDRAGIGLLIGAGAAAVGSVAYFVWPAPKPSAPTSGALRVLPSFTANGGGFVMLGKF